MSLTDSLINPYPIIDLIKMSLKRRLYVLEKHSYRERQYLDSAFYNQDSVVFQRKDLELDRIIYKKREKREKKEKRNLRGPNLTETEKGNLHMFFYKHQNIANWKADNVTLRDSLREFLGDVLCIKKK